MPGNPIAIVGQGGASFIVGFLALRDGRSSVTRVGLEATGFSAALILLDGASATRVTVGGVPGRAILDGVLLSAPSRLVDSDVRLPGSQTGAVGPVVDRARRVPYCAPALPPEGQNAHGGRSSVG